MRLPFSASPRQPRSSFFILLLFGAAFLGGSIADIAHVLAAITTTGNVAPLPPVGGGNVVGPFRVGNNDFGTMNIAGGTGLTSTSNAFVGDALAGIGIVTLNGFFSDWTLTTAGADLTIGNNGTGSVTISNAAILDIPDDAFLAVQEDSLAEVFVTGLGSIFDVADDMVIGERSLATIEITDGGRLLSADNTLGQTISGIGHVVVDGQFSLWGATGNIHVANQGQATMQVLNGGRVESIVGFIATSVGSSGVVDVAGQNSLWRIDGAFSVGNGGNGQLIISSGGRVTTGGGANLTTLGALPTGTGYAEVNGLGSLWTIGGTFEIGNDGAGTMHILNAGRVTSGNVLIGDNATSRGEVVVDGNGSTWDITGELNIADPAEAQVTISNGGLIRTSSLTRVAAAGRLILDGGRLEIASATGLLNTGIVRGGGRIKGVIANNVGGQIRVLAGDALILDGTLTNAGLVDVQSGELEVLATTANNADIDARDGAILRFRGTGLDNNMGSQLAITSGVVDIFGPVDNNPTARIDVGGEAVAVFHDAVVQNGNLFVQPGGEVLMLENLGFGAGSSLSIQLDAVDLTQEGAEPSDGFGQVQTSGAANLTGTLAISLLGGFMPQEGEAFQILTAAGGVSGMFSTEMLPALGGGLSFDVQYNPNSVVLAVISAGLLGDYNQNGVVDAADYTVWQDTLGATVAAGTGADGDGDGAIDPGDYDVWKTNFGNTAGSGATSTSAIVAVPEPASSVLAMFALLCGAFLKRR